MCECVCLLDIELNFIEIYKWKKKNEIIKRQQLKDIQSLSEKAKKKKNNWKNIPHPVREEEHFILHYEMKAKLNEIKKNLNKKIIYSWDLFHFSLFYSILLLNTMCCKV